MASRNRTAACSSKQPGGLKCADERWRHGEGPAVADLRVRAMTSKPSASPTILPARNGLSPCSTAVIAGGGDLKAIRQAVAIVAGALERAEYRQARSG